MSMHVMGLNKDAFELMKNGTKTIEMRLYDDKRKLISKGEHVVFVNTNDVTSKLEVEVKELHIYPSFDELYEVFDKVKFGYKKDEFAKPEDMEIFYSKEDIAKYGVVGIEVRVIDIKQGD